jgi:hypothetical protein
MQLLEIRSTLFALGLFVGTLLMLEAGRRAGGRWRSRIMEGGAAGIGAVETAIFTLLGLLIAFTFQGAAARFDARRALVVEEVNHVGTAWLRIDLLPATDQGRMRELFRAYLDSRIETYRRIPDVAAVKAQIRITERLQGEIWKLALNSHREGATAVLTGMLPALNAMFDIVTTRTMAARTHPPGVVFGMLALLAGMAAFMAGNGMSGTKIRSWLHIIAFATVLAVTVYVIMDMEYPRVGLIRVDDFDEALVNLRRSMN